MRRRFWIAVGLSGLVHLALSLALLLPRGRNPAAPAFDPIEIELLASAEPEPQTPTPPSEVPSAPRSGPPDRARRARIDDKPRTPEPPAPGIATVEPTTPAAGDPAAPAARDPLRSFRPRDARVALGPKAPPLPPGPRAGSFEALFSPAPDVLHHKTAESLVGVKRPGNGLEARVDPDGRITFKDPPAVRYAGLGLSFDVTEAVLRAIGDDPYAAQKARIAEATREERFCLTLKEAEGDKRNAIFRLKDNLERIAADPSMTAVEKRAAVFELWEGCLDTSDDALASAARATIVAFIRRAFPAGTATAYTPVELAMLNRRRNCTRAFDPYATRANERRPDAGAEPR